MLLNSKRQPKSNAFDRRLGISMFATMVRARRPFFLVKGHALVANAKSRGYGYRFSEPDYKYSGY